MSELRHIALFMAGSEHAGSLGEHEGGLESGPVLSGAPDTVRIPSQPGPTSGIGTAMFGSLRNAPPRARRRATTMAGMHGATMVDTAPGSLPAKRGG